MTDGSLKCNGRTLNHLRVADLESLLEQTGSPVRGWKSDLISRLAQVRRTLICAAKQKCYAIVSKNLNLPFLLFRSTFAQRIPVPAMSPCHLPSL